MSFASEMSSTAKGTVKHAGEEAVASVVDHFKTHCREAAGDGWFTATKECAMQIDGLRDRFYRNPEGCITWITFKKCVVDQNASRDAFKALLDADIHKLGFADVKCEVTWPREPSTHQEVARGSNAGKINVSAGWPGAEGAVRGVNVKAKRY